MPDVVVFGGINVDLVARAPRRPRGGETVQGEAFGVFVGGKGCNQAIAAARLGAATALIGRVGADDLAERPLAALRAAGVDVSGVVQDTAAGTGVAVIVVDATGENSIVVVPRANGLLSAADAERAAETIRAARVLLLQLEVPVAASLAAARIARAAGATVVLNPAPALPVPDELLQLCDVLVPNEVEAWTLLGQPVREDVEAAARALLERGVGAVVVTLGERGAYLADAAGGRIAPGFAVEVVDTTAAGDAFCAALATELARGTPLDVALRFANAAGALTATKPGAEPSLPNLVELAEFLMHRSPGWYGSRAPVR